MTHLQLRFSDFEEYLKTLSSATRYDFRRKLKKASRVQIESSQVDYLDEATLDEVYNLYLQAVETHDMGFEIVPKDFFRLISQNMPGQTKFFLFRITRRITSANEGRLRCGSAEIRKRIHDVVQQVGCPLFVVVYLYLHFGSMR